jgi:uncharacterized spore protein YtfJ
VRQLVSHEQLQTLLNKHFCHSSVTVLHTSAELRAALGVREFSPMQVVQLIQQMADAGKLQQQGIQWVQRMLLCLFAMLEATAAGPAGFSGSSNSRPAGGGAASGVVGAAAAAAEDADGSWAVQVVQLGRSRVISQLRKLHILPLQDGSFVSVDGSSSSSNTADTAAAPVFFPLDAPSASAAAGTSIKSPRRLSAAAAAAGASPSDCNPVATPAAAGSPSSVAASDVAAGDGSGLQQLLVDAGVDAAWLSPGMALLSQELFDGLGEEELALMEAGLMVRHMCGYAESNQQLQL